MLQTEEQPLTAVFKGLIPGAFGAAHPGCHTRFLLGSCGNAGGHQNKRIRCESCVRWRALRNGNPPLGGASPPYGSAAVCLRGAPLFVSARGVAALCVWVGLVGGVGVGWKIIRGRCVSSPLLTHVGQGGVMCV